MQRAPGARWVEEDDLHLTLRFIGPVDGGTANDIARTLNRIHHPAFDLVLDGMGTFGRGRAPHTLWAGVVPNPALNALQKKIDSALVRQGVAAEGRQFSPHFTLARFGNGNGHSTERITPGRLHFFLAGNNLFTTGSFRISDFVLFSSHPGGHYREEARYGLSASPDAMSDPGYENDLGYENDNEKPLF